MFEGQIVLSGQWRVNYVLYKLMRSGIYAHTPVDAIIEQVRHRRPSNHMDRDALQRGGLDN